MERPKSRARRTSAVPWSLLRDAAGPPSVFVKKLSRFGRVIAAYADGKALDARLQRLHQLGYVAQVPTRVQLVFGAIDMLRFWIVPASQDYYRTQGIDFTFHQVLRFLDDPASLADPTGFLSERDVIIGHLMQVVHANPCYDLQLLESHEHGLQALEEQVVAMIEGTHPRSASISAIVEDPGYHARLLEYVRAYLRDPSARSPLRENVEQSARFAAIERTFGTLPSAMHYFSTLPRGPLAAAMRWLTVRQWPGGDGPD